MIKVNQCHLLVIAEGSVSLQQSCLQAPVMSLGMPGLLRDGILEREWALALLKHTDLVTLWGLPQQLLSPPPLPSTRQTCSTTAVPVGVSSLVLPAQQNCSSSAPPWQMQREDQWEELWAVTSQLYPVLEKIQQETDGVLHGSGVGTM